MNEGQKPRLLFGPFIVDREERILLRDGQEIDIRPLAFRLLVYFLEHPKKLLIMQDIKRNVWKAHSVSDFTIANTVKDVRKALGKNYIEHVGDGDYKGYRFKAEVTEEASSLQAHVEPRPYRGLRSFREQDARFFFGREAFTERLQKKVLSQNLVAVVGPSGSGKSSVVQAGLLPRLRQESPLAPTWNAVIFTPGKRPFHNLAAALIPILEAKAGETQRLVEAGKLGKSLASGQVALEAALDSALKKSTSTDRLLIIADQFEEIFTETPETEREPFIKSLLKAAELPRANIVLTLRADFYSQTISISRDLSDRIEDGQINLGPMTNEELHRAIENPANSVGLEFEPGLVTRILDHVREQPGNLPLLEFALTELCEQRQGRLLTHKKYDDTGGVQGAITRTAEEQFGKLASEQQELALRLLTRLVRVAAANEEGRDTRQRVTMNQLDTTMQSIVQAFVTSRLLVVSKNELNEEVVELAHEALISKWDRLRSLLIEDRNFRDFLLWRQNLDAKVYEWERTGRDPGSLLRGASLYEAERMLTEREIDLNEMERDYIKESEKINSLNKKLWWRWIPAAAFATVVIFLAGWMLYTWSKSYEDAILLINQHGGRISDYYGRGNEVIFIHFKDPNPALNALESIPNLRQVDLHGPHVTDASIEKLKRLTSLRTLRLVDTAITDLGLEHIKALSGLERLVVIGIKIPDPGFEHLITRITDAGLEHLKYLPRLKRLELSKTDITDAGLEYFKGLPNLEELDLSDTKTTVEGIKKLKEELPNVDIIH